ncbi:hypothetical protein [Paenibacillus faecalis]|uniref:hypothetical protein n=1 Tax=Paenibacillus faecalis TaxID=2079532 RepID=UPI000D0EE7BC|nr:hypothetical protein [Paenibacillus faecalis]
MNQLDTFINEVKYNSLEVVNIGCSDSYHFLNSILADKKYVFIGESSHCVKEFSIAKINLVQFLHQRRMKRQDRDVIHSR